MNALYLIFMLIAFVLLPAEANTCTTVQEPDISALDHLAYEGDTTAFQTIVTRLKPLAEAGNIDARQHLSGHLIAWWSNGHGNENDLQEGIRWATLAAEQGNVAACRILGLTYSDLKKPKQALHWCSLAAEKGDSFAQYNLGLWYQYGSNNLPKDDVQAAKWYLKAALQGQCNAQAAMASLYEKGLGVPKKLREEIKWRRLAAEQGISHAQYMMGRYHEEGRGVPQNNAEAVKWYRAATKHERLPEGDALIALSTCYASGKGVPVDYRKALECINRIKTESDLCEYEKNRRDQIRPILELIEETSR